MVATIGEINIDDKSLDEVCDKRCEIRIKDIKDKVKNGWFYRYYKYQATKRG